MRIRLPEHRPTHSPRAARSLADAIANNKRTKLFDVRLGFQNIGEPMGERVTKGQVLTVTSDTFGSRAVAGRSPFDGIVIGVVRNPVVSRGDALAHVAEVEPCA